MGDVIVVVLAVVLVTLTVALLRRQGSPGRLSEEDDGNGIRDRVVDRPAGPDAERMDTGPSPARPITEQTDQTAPEVAVAEQTPIPDDERPVVEVEPIAPRDEPVPDDERPVPDSGADAVPGGAPVPDDERPVPDDEELDTP